jgi:hypothetical protein
MRLVNLGVLIPYRSEDGEFDPLNYLTDPLNHETLWVHNLGCLSLSVLGFIRIDL